MNTDRRTFLKGLGAALATAPFARMLEGTAQAATSGQAKRLVVFFSPNGTIHHQRRPSGSGTSFSFPTGSILEPLAPIQDKLVVIDGLNFHGATNHEGGMRAMLTGNGGAGHVGNGASIDHFVASQLGAPTRFPSLQLGVQTSAWGGSVQTRMTYSGPGELVTPDDDPTSVFGRLFGEADADAAAAARTKVRRDKVLALAMGDVEDLHKRLGSREQRKLEAHLDALASVQASFDDVGSTCDAPVPPNTPSPLGDHANFATVGKLQTDLLVSALACDATRVASLQYAHTVAPHVLSHLGITDGHHTLSHAGDGDTAGVNNFRIAERWFAEQFRYLVDRLAVTPDPDGGMLLDSTLVVWAKEMGDSRLHVCDDVPFVLAGGGGAFQTGRYLRYSGEPHNMLLVSICHALGLTNGSFGNPDYGTGPLPGLV